MLIKTRPRTKSTLPSYQPRRDKYFSTTITNSRSVLRMDRGMSSPIYQKEIVYIVVVLIAVFMMYYLVWLQRTFQEVRHYKSAFRNISKFNSIGMIFFADMNISVNINTSSTPCSSLVAFSMVPRTSGFTALPLSFHVFSLDGLPLFVKGTRYG